LQKYAANTFLLKIWPILDFNVAHFPTNSEYGPHSAIMADS